MNKATRKHFILLITLALTLSAVALSFLYLNYIYKIHEQRVVSYKIDEFKNKEEFAKDQAKSFIQLLESFAEDGKAPEEIIEKHLQDFSYGELVVFDKNNKVLLNTFHSNISDQGFLSLTDNNKKRFFEDLYTNALEHGESFVEYSWDKPYKKTSENNRISYAKYAEKLGIVVSSHAFVDEHEVHTEALKAQFEKDVQIVLISAILIYCAGLLFSFFFAFLIFRKSDKIDQTTVRYFLEKIDTKSQIHENDKNLHGFGQIVARVNQLRFELEKKEKMLHDLQYTLKEKSTRDYLTGFPNKKYFHESAKGVIAISRREGVPLTFLMLGIKEFQKIVDEHGHEVADEALKDFSQIIKTTIRQSDLVSRFFDDSFLLLLHNTTYGGSLVLVGRIEQKLLGHKAILKQVHLTYTTYAKSIAFDYEKDQNLDDIIKKLMAQKS